jgi:capsular polysaccharide transport system permease protein
MLREMGATYGASPGGYIWAVVQPVGILVVLSIGFSLLLRSPSLGTNFFLFYATGYLPFMFYVDIEGKVAQSLRYARALLAYPSVTWADAVLARFILNILTQGIVFCIVISGVFIIIDPRTILDLLPILSGITLA